MHDSKANVQNMTTDSLTHKDDQNNIPGMKNLSN